jgi:hypothetical protein
VIKTTTHPKESGMQRKYSLLTPLLISAALGLLFLLLFSLFQNETAYRHTLDPISHNYANDRGDGMRRETDAPYREISNENLLRWDAAHYRNIADHAYTVQPGFGEACFAFFPLFPWLWKFSGLSARGIAVLNYTLFTLALMLLAQVFLSSALSQGRRVTLFAVALLFPSSIAFQIPYTEALFIFLMALALWGLHKGSYALFFAGMSACALTRPAISIILISFLCTDVFFFLRHRSWSLLLKESVLKILPLLTGTGLAIAAQYPYSGNLLKFFEVQKMWNHSLRLPRELMDWSVEGYSMSVFAIFLVVLPSLYYLLKGALAGIASPPYPATGLFSRDPEQLREYMGVSSMIYFTGIFLFILLFQGGSLNGLQRYVLATPYFCISLFRFFSAPVFPSRQLIAFACLSAAGALFMSLAPYNRGWGFSDGGYVVSVLLVLYLLFERSFSKKFRYLFLSFLVLAALVWKTYLFNSFLSDGWIFT